MVEPEIPQNTGNIARTCAITGAKLHLVHPLGFDISEKSVRRAGLDYWDKLEIEEHESLQKFLEKYPPEKNNKNTNASYIEIFKSIEFSLRNCLRNIKTKKV